MSTALIDFEQNHQLLLGGYIHEHETKCDSQIPSIISQIIFRFYWSFASFIGIFEGDIAQNSFIQFVSIDISRQDHNTFTTTISQKDHIFQTNRRSAYCLIDNNYLYRTGGEIKPFNQFSYNVSSDQYVSLPKPITERSAHRVVYSSTYNSLYQIGGHDQGGRASLKTVEVYKLNINHDSSQSQSILCKEMNQGRANFGACLYNKGNVDTHIFVAGGWKMETQSALNTAEIYSFENDEWINIENMNKRRTAQTIANWKNRNNGNMVAVGGWNPESQRYVEEYDLYKNKWYMIGQRMNDRHRYYCGVSFCNDSDSVIVVFGDKALPSDDWGMNTLYDWGSVEMYDTRDRIGKWIKVSNIIDAFKFEPKNCKDLLCRAILNVEPRSVSQL